MKRLFTTAILALAFGLAAFAQGLPKTEFQIIGFGGKSGISYTVDRNNFDPSAGHNYDFKSCDLSKPLDLPWGYGGGIGFVWNFAPHWGLVTGVEGSFYKGQVSVGPDDILMTAKWAAYDPNNDPTGMIGNAYEDISGVGFNDFQETQEVWMVQVPLMFQFNTALNARQGIHWYLAAGAKFAYGVKATYSSKSSFAYAYYCDSWGTGITNDPINAAVGEPINYRMGDADFSGHDIKDKKLDIRQFNGFASLETGLRWKLGESFGLYTGIYCDYGLLSLAKKPTRKLIEDGDCELTLPTPTAGSELIVNNAASILNSKQPDYAYIGTGGLYGFGQGALCFDTNDKAAVKGAVRPFSVGLKVRLSFGRHSPKPLPVVAPVKPDTVTVEKIVYLKDTVTVKETVTDTVTVEKTVTVKDTVTVEKVVRDTVVIIKEVPVEIQKVMKDLSNALFKFGSFNLGETEKGYLDTVADWIKSEPEINVEIGGHTDDVGSDDYNQKLSEKRAKAVYDYIISQGVEASRLSYKGYGESEPIATNKTESGRQRNRRVELKILQ